MKGSANIVCRHCRENLGRSVSDALWKYHDTAGCIEEREHNQRIAGDPVETRPNGKGGTRVDTPNLVELEICPTRSRSSLQPTDIVSPEPSRLTPSPVTTRADTSPPAPSHATVQRTAKRSRSGGAAPLFDGDAA